MIEKKLQKKLRGAVLQVSVLFLVLLVGGGLLLSHLQSLQDAAVREQVIAEAEEYKTRILKQLQSDFQALSTLAAFLEKPENEEGWDRMARQREQWFFVHGLLRSGAAGHHLHPGTGTAGKCRAFRA